MRLLMTADAAGGVWTYAMDLARALGDRGHEVHLASLGPELTGARRREAEGCTCSLHEGAYRLEWMADPWSDLESCGRWLLHLEERIRPDLVHLNSMSPGRWPFRAPKLVVGHSCVLSWFRRVHGREAGPEWDRYRAEVRSGLQAAHAVAAPSASMLADLARDHGPFRRSTAVLNGRPPAPPPPDRREPLILSVGRLWDEGKNVALLDALAPDLAWPVAVAGDARHPDGGVALLHHVRCLGRLEPGPLQCWMERASVYAAPCRYEPFGLAPLEAARAGCALALSDLPNFREVWGESALFVEPDGWTAALNRLAARPDLREDLASRARARALELTSDRMARGYEALYRTLVPAEAVR